MAEILNFPSKKSPQAPAQKAELVEAFAIRLIAIMSAVCFAKHYDDVPLNFICRDMARQMIADDFEYTQPVLDAMLDDPEIRTRTIGAFLKILKAHGHIQ